MQYGLNAIWVKSPVINSIQYNLWMPEFDPAKDQLVMDFRSGDELVIQEMSFDACIRGNCQNFDLLDFAAKNDTFLVSIYYFKVISTKLPRSLFGQVDLLRPIRHDYFHEYRGGGSPRYAFCAVRFLQKYA